MESEATAFRVRADALLTAEGMAILKSDHMKQRQVIHAQMEWFLEQVLKRKRYRVFFVNNAPPSPVVTGLNNCLRVFHFVSAVNKTKLNTLSKPPSPRDGCYKTAGSR
jgi:hypothetical protein